MTSELGILDTVPVFINSKAADVILSDVRPTSITTDALRAINILLDELLWLMLAHARSLETTRLKTGVLKTIPTQLGKDAILEAELEIRAFKEKTQQSRPRNGRANEDAPTAFPLQEAFNWLRYKSQTLSSFGEVDEDPFVEGRLLEGYRNASATQPSQDFNESAPLYITAVIEHVSQHILSNVAQVVARDSSRTSADLTILYTALCEDRLIYPVFKNMKVQAHIAQHVQNKSTKLTRQKSVTFRENGGPEPITPTSTSHGNSVSGGGILRNATSPTNGRNPASPLSASDAGHSSSNGHSNPGGSNLGGSAHSVSLGGATGGRASGDSPGKGSSSKHQRSHSLISPTRNSERGASVDGASVSAQSSKMSVFEELLESGGTMKVSLTPDRMRTFDVSKANGQPAAHTRSASAITPLNRGITSGDNTSRDNQTGTSSAALERAATLNRSRAETIPPVPPIPNGASPQKPTVMTTNLTPSASTKTSSRPSPTGTKPFTLPPSPTVASNPGFAFPSSSGPAGGPNGGIPKQNRSRGRARNPESLDLDDVMNGDGDDFLDSDDERLSSRQGPSQPSPATTMGRGLVPPPGPRTVKVSQTARDLMDFLDSAPPEMPPMDEPRAPSLNASTTSKKSGSRLFGVVNRLRKKPSNEKLQASRSYERLPGSNGTAPVNGRVGASSGGRPTPQANGPMPRHRSQHNLNGGSASTVRPPVPPPPSSWMGALPSPPRPPMPPQPMPILPPTTAPTTPISTQPETRRNHIPPEPSPLPSPVSMHFDAEGASSSQQSRHASKENVAAAGEYFDGAPSRGTPARSKSYLRPATETAFATELEYASASSPTHKPTPSPSLSRSSSRKKPPSDAGLVDEFGKPIPSAKLAVLGAAGIANAPSSPASPLEVSIPSGVSTPSTSQTPLTPARSPLRQTTLATASLGAAAAITTELPSSGSRTPVSPVTEEADADIPGIPKVGQSSASPASETAQPNKEVSESSSPAVQEQRDSLSAGDDKGLSPPSPMLSTLTTASQTSGVSDELIQRAAELRRMLSAAKHVEEARLLVDMFLVQSGVPVFSAPGEGLFADPEEPAMPLGPKTEPAAKEEHFTRPRSFAERPQSTITMGERSLIESLLGEQSYSMRQVASSVGA